MGHSVFILVKYIQHYGFYKKINTHPKNMSFKLRSEKTKLCILLKGSEKCYIYGHTLTLTLIMLH